MKNTAHTFVIVGLDNSYKVEDYGTHDMTPESALSYARNMNREALAVISKDEIDKQQQFKPFDRGFRRGTWFGVAIGFAIAFFLVAIVVAIYLPKFI